MSDDCHLQRLATARSAGQHFIRARRAHFALLFLFATPFGAAGPCLAQDAAGKAGADRAEVVIHANRLADEQVTQQVQKTLSADPWIYSEHITVTTQNGVVRLEGIVADTGELFRILRLCRQIPGARRVVNELEMMHNDPDGG
jgi:hypothetical protein